MSNIEKVKKIVEKYGQEQLLQYYNQLEESEKEELEKQILSIDFDLLKNIYEGRNNIEKESKIEPIDYLIKENMSKEEIEQAKNIGIDKIKNGKIAVCQMAGGQRN